MSAAASATPGADAFDVAIVGCGPTGAALALALARAGLRVAVVERETGVVQIPRAVHIDGETMRILADLGVAGAALTLMRPGAGMHWVNSEGGQLMVRTGVQGLAEHGWHNDYYFHQPQLEALLRQAMADAGAALYEGWTLRALREDDEGVTLSLESTADGRADELRARWVVGCDGARSTVRSLISAEAMEDLGEHQAWIVVDGVLHRPLDLPEHTVQHCDPARPATSIYVHPLRRRWELMVLPGEDVQTLVHPATLWPLLERWVRPSQARLERAAVYVFHALIAERWQGARVFLAGDAAHQTPPFLGQGVCAALRDAANLAWKLVTASRRPEIGAALLATYGAERRPHAREFIALAVEVGRVIQVLDPDVAAARDARLLREGLSFAFPTPTLGAGVHRARADAPRVGRVAPQSELADGRWSDEAAGGGWSLWLAGPMHVPPPAVAERLAALGVTTLADPGRRGRAWLAESGACSALLRPDHYVFDLCPTADDLVRAVDALAAWLEPVR